MSWNQGSEPTLSRGSHKTVSARGSSKLPVIDLQFLYSQRQKCGERGKTDESVVKPDRVESKKAGRQTSQKGDGDPEKHC